MASHARSHWGPAAAVVPVLLLMCMLMLDVASGAQTAAQLGRPWPEQKTASQEPSVTQPPVFLVSPRRGLRNTGSKQTEAVSNSAIAGVSRPSSAGPTAAAQPVQQLAGSKVMERQYIRCRGRFCNPVGAAALPR